MAQEISRRSLLRRQAGLLAGAGLGLASGVPQRSASAKAQGSSGFGRAKSVIFLYLHGGAPSQDMFDMNPKNQILPAYVSLPNPLNIAGEAGPGAGFPGRRYAPLESRAVPQFDAGAVLNQRPNPPVVRGIPRLEDSQLIDGVTPSRLALRRNLLVPTDICATICDQRGVDPDSYVHDRLSRPHKVAQGGEPSWQILN